MSMAEFYYIMVWIIVSSLAVIVTTLAVFSAFYFKRNSRLKLEVDYVKKRVDYMNDLFHNHFQQTDQTILDLRKERDELKEKLKKF